MGGVGIRWVVNTVEVSRGSWVQGCWGFRSAEDGSGVRVKAAGNTWQQQPGTRDGSVQAEVRAQSAELNWYGQQCKERIGLAFTKQRNRASGRFKKHKREGHHICQQVEGLGALEGGRGLDCSLGRSPVEATCWSLSPSPLPPWASASLSLFECLSSCFFLSFSWS